MTKRLFLVAFALWLAAVARATFALRELGRLRTANAARAERLHTLDPAFRDFLSRELAIGRLLDQSRTSSVPVSLATATLSRRTLPADIGGHSLRELSATWDAISADALASAIRDAEDSAPPLRLRRAEIAARPDGSLSATAVFETL